MTEQPTTTEHSASHQQAFARLEEFPSDPIEAAAAMAKEQRMDEMENWANGIGAHTERLAVAHRKVAKQVVGSAVGGSVDKDAQQTRLSQVPEMWRTGVKVDKKLNVQVHDMYPYSGDTPAGEWASYRSPVNIRK